MRKNITSFLYATICLLIFATACKKDSKSPQETILGKWNYQSMVSRQVVDEDITEETVDRRQSGDYIDFKSNGSALLYMEDDPYEVSYKLIDEHSLILDGDTLEVSKLTQKELTLYTKSGNATEYLEEWHNFLR